MSGLYDFVFFRIVDFRGKGQVADQQHPSVPQRRCRPRALDSTAGRAGDEGAGSGIVQNHGLPAASRNQHLAVVQHSGHVPGASLGQAAGLPKPSCGRIEDLRACQRIFHAGGNHVYPPGNQYGAVRQTGGRVIPPGLNQRPDRAEGPGRHGAQRRAGFVNPARAQSRSGEDGPYAGQNPPPSGRGSCKSHACTAVCDHLT